MYMIRIKPVISPKNDTLIVSIKHELQFIVGGHTTARLKKMFFLEEGFLKKTFYLFSTPPDKISPPAHFDDCL